MTFVVPDEELAYLAAAFLAPSGETLESASGPLGDASVSLQPLASHHSNAYFGGGIFSPKSKPSRLWKLPQGMRIRPDGTMFLGHVIRAGGTWEAINLTLVGSSARPDLPSKLVWRGETHLGSQLKWFCYACLFSLHTNKLPLLCI